MKLSKNIAQDIVEEMMKVIPYNINVMNESGAIIGSGDIKRIGVFHDGARKAIENGSMNEVYLEGEGMKPGVNEPIIVNGNVIGVIGITGHPDEVRRFSKLVRATAVLLIEQAKLNEETQDRRLNMQKFYQELAHRKTEYDDEFLQRAKSYGLDLAKKCQVVLVNGNVNTKPFRMICNQYIHYCDLENDKTAFFIINKYSFDTLLQKLNDSVDINKIAIGSNESFAAISLEKAELALEYGNKIKPLTKTYNYNELKFFIHLSYEHKESIISLFSNMDKSGNKIELIQTLQVYIEENGEINNVANRLNIHRNTLNYRIERIEQLTGKNPKILLDLFELMCGLIWR